MTIEKHIAVQLREFILDGHDSEEKALEHFSYTANSLAYFYITGCFELRLSGSEYGKIADDCFCINNIKGEDVESTIGDIISLLCDFGDNPDHNDVEEVILMLKSCTETILRVLSQKVDRGFSVSEVLELTAFYDGLSTAIRTGCYRYLHGYTTYSNVA